MNHFFWLSRHIHPYNTIILYLLSIIHIYKEEPSHINEHPGCCNDVKLIMNDDDDDQDDDDDESINDNDNDKEDKEEGWDEEELHEDTVEGIHARKERKTRNKNKLHKIIYREHQTKRCKWKD